MEENKNLQPEPALSPEEKLDLLLAEFLATPDMEAPSQPEPESEPEAEPALPLTEEEPETAPEPEAEPEAVMQEITADEIVETTVEYTEDFENPPTVSNFQHDYSNEATEQFIELNAEEDENMDVPQDMPSEFAYSRRSVIHKQEEVEAAAQLPPVQKVLDLFGGEIVDIHV